MTVLVLVLFLLSAGALVEVIAEKRVRNRWIRSQHAYYEGLRAERRERRRRQFLHATAPAHEFRCELDALKRITARR